MFRIETTEILSAHEHYKKQGSDPLDWVCTQYTHLDYKGFKPIYLSDYTPLPGQESQTLKRSSVFVSRKSNRCIRYSWLGPKHPHYHAKRNSRLQYSDLALFNYHQRTKITAGLQQRKPDQSSGTQSSSDQTVIETLEMPPACSIQVISCMRTAGHCRGRSHGRESSAVSGVSRDN